MCIFKYFKWQLLAFFMLSFLPRIAFAQCGGLSAVVTTSESRCAATGAIIINASGGANPQRYQYSIAAGPVTTSFSLVNSFSGLPPGTYTVIIKDLTANCSITKTNIVIPGNYVSPGILYNSTPPSCMGGSDGTIFTTSQTGGRPPFTYKLISPSQSKIGTVSTNGTFTGLTPGTYYIQLTDSCGGIQTRTQEVNNYTWSILSTSNITGSCKGDITANIFLTNSNGANSPNTAFNGFQYGVSRFPGDTTWFPADKFSYNIGVNKKVDVVVKDNCGNVRSFTWSKQKPDVADISLTKKNCTTFTATATGQSNMIPDSTQYCLYDETNTVLISACQSSPVFNDLPYGTYTMRITEACYDTIINKTFAATLPKPSVSDNLDFAYLCPDYSATITGQTDTVNTTYCIYKNASTTALACNATGTFEHLAYDSAYCIQIHSVSACSDTIISRCFIKTKPKPFVSAIVSVTDKLCTTFTATVIGQQGLNNPVYQLYNSSNTSQIRPNQSGSTFNLLPYGNYCIHIINDPTCFDTTIVICFIVKPPKLSISLSAQGTCTAAGGTNINVDFNDGVGPFISGIYSPAGVLIKTATTSNSSYTFNDMPVLPAGKLYKVVTKDLCGNKDSATVATNTYFFNRNISLSQKCPTGSSPNGTNDITFLVNENRGGAFTTTVIKKNGSVFNQNPSGSGNTTNSHTFSFANLLPATYIFDTYSTDCDLHLYDTVIVPGYVYPGLASSTGYYCDNNSQNINFTAINGVAPYQYQVFGSVPALPNINTPLQTSAVFNINNGTSYSLIRLRVLDACFNASINDVGFVSLAVPTINISNLCFNNTSDLSVDSFANATYTWYKRTYNPLDSIYLGTGNTYHIPNISLADTGTYIAKTVVNENCVVRLSYLSLFKGTNTCLALYLSSTTNTSVCSSALPYTWNGKQYSDSGIYQFHTTTLGGFDSIATLHLSVKDTSTSITQKIICASALPYQWNGKLYYDSGAYVYHTNNAVGCDSAATLILKLKDTSVTNINVSICATAAPYLWQGKSYSTSTIAKKIFTNAAGCDSTIILNLTINKPTTGDTTATACTSFTWYGKTYTTTTTATYIFTNANGCDSTVTLHLSINKPTASSTSKSICASALPYTWNGLTYTTAGTQTAHFLNSKGCDSAASLTLTINKEAASTTAYKACSNYTWNGITYTTSGTYTYTTLNSVGCDSIATLQLTINQPTTSSNIIKICPSELPYTWKGLTFNKAETKIAHLVNKAGCDSSIILVVIVKATSTSITTKTACTSFAWNGTTYTTSGVYTFTTLNSEGCDSVATLRLTISKPTTSSSAISLCPAALPYTWNGLTFTSAGTQTAHLTNSAGCDSAASLTVILKRSTVSTTYVSICPSALPYTWNNTSITTSGKHVVTLTNAAGCDSLATLILGVRAATTSTTNITICEAVLPYKWNGNTYAAAGTYQLHLTNSAGCDSTATLVLNVLNKTAGTFYANSCVASLPYKWNGNTYNTSGNYTIHLLNSLGCDSIATLSLTVNSTTYSTTRLTVCEGNLPFAWNGHTYNAGGSYTVQLTSAAGCDSMATLVLAIGVIDPVSLGKDQRVCPGDTAFLNAGNYAKYTWQDGSTASTYAATRTGKYTVTVSTADGCVSTATVNVIVLDKCDDIVFPTAISPNGDGLNDKFGALGELAGVTEYSLQIFNRYGELVFQTNDPYGRWDGSYKGTITANYNYVWYSKYTLNRTRHRMQKGNLVVIK